MRGMELPISTLVIIVLAVIILLAMVAMYFSGFGPFSTSVSLEGIRGGACRELVQEKRCTVSTNQITIPNFDADRDNVLGAADATTTWTWGTSVCKDTTHVNAEGDNLAALCACYYSITTEADCRALCGCS
jgi:hypothetical protein